MTPPFLGAFGFGITPQSLRKWESYPGEGTTDNSFVPRAPLGAEEVARLIMRFPRTRLYLDIDDERRRVENTLKSHDIAVVKTMDAAVMHFPRAFMIGSDHEAALCGEGAAGEVTLLMRWTLGNTPGLTPPENVMTPRLLPFSLPPLPWVRLIGPVLAALLVGYAISTTAGIAVVLIAVLVEAARKAFHDLLSKYRKGDDH